MFRLIYLILLINYTIKCIISTIFIDAHIHGIVSQSRVKIYLIPKFNFMQKLFPVSLVCNIPLRRWVIIQIYKLTINSVTIHNLFSKFVFYKHDFMK